MRIALDTNVLVYAEGANGAIRRDQTLKLIQRLPPEAVVLPAQALGEMFNVLVRKARGVQLVRAKPCSAGAMRMQ